MEQITNQRGSQDLQNTSKSSQDLQDDNDGLTPSSDQDFETTADSRLETDQEWEADANDEDTDSSRAPQENPGSQANKNERPAENRLYDRNK